MPTCVHRRGMEFAILDTRGLAVSFGSALDTKEQVRQAINIVELVEKYVQLRRQGRNYVGLCPWHEDSHPSFQVNPERQSFKCWVCDIGGDVFSFVMKMEGVDFKEALTMLADQAGIELKPSPARHRGRPSTSHAPDDSAESAPVLVDVSGEGKRALYRASAWAEQQYHECLLNVDEAEHAREYLRQRGITPEDVKKWRLGFAPKRGNWILAQAKGTEDRAKVLETIGILARPAEGGEPYDRFRGRLLFSIRDAQDRPIALGGRILPESGVASRAKYVNSPETPLFIKSEQLYGLDVARQAIRKSGTALVMEGYTDCIIAHQHGFENAVAVLGTALGERHVRILKRFTDRIVLVLDGDEAGQRRAREVLELFVASNVDLRISVLPEGLDPADFLQEHGSEAFADLLETKSVDALEHAFRTETEGLDLERDVHGSAQSLERLISIVAKAPRLSADSTVQNRFREEKILHRLAVSFRVPEADIRRRLTELRRAGARRRVFSQTEPPDESEAVTDSAGKIDPWQRELLEILIGHPECVTVARAEIDCKQLSFQPCRKIFEACCRLADAGIEPSFQRLMLEFDEPGIKSLLVEVDERGSAKGAEDPHAVMRQLLDTFQRNQVSKLRPVDEGALRQGNLTEDEQKDLLHRIVQQQQLQRARHGISDPTDG